MDELRQMFTLTVYETMIEERKWQVFQCHWIQSEEVWWQVVPSEYAHCPMATTPCYPSLDAAIAGRSAVWA